MTTLRSMAGQGPGPSPAIAFAGPKPRLEYKYRVSEATASAVRDYVAGFLELDRYATGHGGVSYPVNSCYLDSSDLKTFWHTVNSAKDRYKLRIRTYDDESDSPVFFEIKRRVNEAIVKSRGTVHRGAVASLLSGHMPRPDDIASSHPGEVVAVEHFMRLMLQIGAVPTAFVRYQREAWVGRYDTSERLTMDREVCVWPTTVARLAPDPATPPTRPFGDVVILEMKFSGGIPGWFRDLERIAGLQRTSVAKYCEGILKRGLDGFSPLGALPIPSAGPLSAEPHPANSRFAPLFR